MILLPGMDGTGILFDPLLTVIAQSIECEVIPLSKLQSEVPAIQAIELAKIIGSDEAIIFAESYSGLIAYELCKLSGLSIKQVFFAAGFLERPSLISKYSGVLPLTLVRYKFIPACVLSYLFFGSASNNQLVDLFYKSLANVTNETLRARLNIIAKARRPTEKIHQPVTYIRARNDYLVSKNSINAFEQLCSNLTIVNMEGGHFVAQSNPQMCWAQIGRVIEL